MYEYYFTFRSITAAQNALLMLKKEGIRASLAAAPHMRKHGGCTHAILTFASDAYKAALFLQRSGIVYQSIYRTKDGVLFEEIDL